MKSLIIGVVGPCGAGTTTLIQGLRANGYLAKHIAQEHSYVPQMWSRLTNPDILIYLDVSYPLSIQRRRIDWTSSEYSKQLRRLKHARENADFYLNTDDLTPQEILQQVAEFIDRYQIGHSG